jgi:ectoine hydroxylase-related dioxygenase (phytanoyl-CoA dioxygenase family)
MPLSSIQDQGAAMLDNSIAISRAKRVWLSAEDCSIADFRHLIDRTTQPEDYPFAADIVKNVPIYDSAAMRKAATDEAGRKDVMAEWAECLLTGPGIVVFKNAVSDFVALDKMSSHFDAIIKEQHESNASAGDHFAKAGANDRIWNALEKIALRDPECFARYYANDMIAMISEAWLGTGYQITSQVNVVNPGGEAQSVHRDYHMGFQTAAEIATFPAHAHALSPVLTLQGAVAHVDMPLETGPTLYMPFSQTFAPGYFAWRKPEFKTYFSDHYTQLPLEKGDMAFFNPALFHAAGHNKTTDRRRMGNLLQVSSAYGRAMEAMDRARMSAALFPALQKMKNAANLDERGIHNAIAACAEGYSFPTNLDRDPPIGGLAPETQAALFKRALDEGWSQGKFKTELDQQNWRHLT